MVKLDRLIIKILPQTVRLISIVTQNFDVKPLSSPSSPAEQEQEQSVQQVRLSCTDCAKKHLGQAEILLGESRMGYPAHIWRALAHMSEASDELVGEYPEHANIIREERKKLEQNREGYTPDFLSLISKIDGECKGCALRGEAA